MLKRLLPPDRDNRQLNQEKSFIFPGFWGEHINFLIRLTGRLSWILRLHPTWFLEKLMLQNRFCCFPFPIPGNNQYNTNLWVRTLSGGVDVFHVKGRVSKSLVCPSKPTENNFFSMPNMTGRPGCRTMEMIGGSSVSYLARTPCVPLSCTLFNKGGNRKAFTLPGERGDHFHCAVEPSPGHIRCRLLAGYTRKIVPLSPEQKAYVYVPFVFPKLWLMASCPPLPSGVPWRARDQRVRLCTA